MSDQKQTTYKLTPDLVRQLVPKLAAASDTEIAQVAHQYFAPQVDYRQFEDAFLGKASAWRELGRGIQRGARAAKGGLDLLAGGLAGAFGDTASRDEAFASYEMNMAESNKIAPRRRATTVKSVGDAVDYVAGVGGEALPMFLSAGLGGGGVVGAVSGISAVPNAQARVQQLMPDSSPMRQAMTGAGFVVLNAAGDAFIPMRLLRGAARPGLGGASRDVATGAAIGAMTPIAERVGAVLGSGETEAFLRTGRETRR